MYNSNLLNRNPNNLILYVAWVALTFGFQKCSDCDILFTTNLKPARVAGLHYRISEVTCEHVVPTLKHIVQHDLCD